jgi:hypothetical protein
MTGTRRSDTVKNRYINDYFIKVWYRNPDAKYEYDNSELNPEFTIFPMPADGDKLYVKSKSQDFSYSVVTGTGIELSTGKSYGDTAEINIHSYPKGVYFVVFSKNGNRYVKKFVRL